MQNLERKTSLLYIIADFKERFILIYIYFNLQGSFDGIMEGYIKDRLEALNRLDKLDLAIDFYRNYKQIILTDLLD